MDMVDEKSLPVNCLLIDAGEGEIFHYAVSGLDNIYVRGMVEHHPTMSGWFRLKDLEAVSNQIADHVLAQPKLSAAHFRFLRKQAGLTVAQTCAELGIDAVAVAAWENGNGFAPNGVEGIRNIYAEYRELGYVAFMQSRKALARAA